MTSVFFVGDEPYLAEAIAADIAGDGATALKPLSIHADDVAVLKFAEREGAARG